MDDALRQKLASHSSPVPEDMWARIQEGRKQNRTHPFGWYFFSASILLVGIIAGVLSIGQGPARMPESERQAVEQIEQQVAASDTPGDQSSDIPDQSIITSADIHHGVDQTASDLNRNTTANTSSAQRQAKAKSSIASSNRQTTERASSTSEEATAASAEHHRTFIAETAENIDQSKGSESIGSRPSMQTAEPGNRSRETEVVELDYRFATTDLLQVDQAEEVASMQPLKLPGSGQGNKRKKVPSCYSFNSFLRGISVDAYIAPEYASRQLVYKDPSMIGYAEQRNDDESYVFAYSAGFRANAHFKGGLALRTGLIYTDIVERLRYRDENAQVTKVIDVTLDTIYQNGNIIYVWDTLSVTEYGNYNKIGYNRYRFYDIPVMLGYEIDRDRWVIQLNTGILFNVAASQRGDFLDPDHQLVNFDSNNDQAYRAFRTRVGSSLMMSLGFNYALRPKLHLILEPQLRVWLQPMNIQAYPIDQKYVNLGLAMGIRNYF